MKFQAFDVYPHGETESSFIRGYDYLNKLDTEIVLPPKTTLQRTIFVKPIQPICHFMLEEEKSFSGIVAKLKPKIPWNPAKEGTVDEFDGALARFIPELNSMSAEDLDHAIDKARRRE